MIVTQSEPSGFMMKPAPPSRKIEAMEKGGVDKWMSAAVKHRIRNLTPSYDPRKTTNSDGF